MKVTLTRLGKIRNNLEKDLGEISKNFLPASHRFVVESPSRLSLYAFDVRKNNDALLANLVAHRKLISENMETYNRLINARCEIRILIASANETHSINAIINKINMKKSLLVLNEKVIEGIDETRLNSDADLTTMWDVQRSLMMEKQNARAVEHEIVVPVLTVETYQTIRATIENLRREIQQLEDERDSVNHNTLIEIDENSDLYKTLLEHKYL